MQLIGQPAEPLVAATQCPILKSAQTYQFLTIPAPRIDSSASTGTKPAFTWDPKLEDGVWQRRYHLGRNKRHLRKHPSGNFAFCWRYRKSRSTTIVPPRQELSGSTVFGNVTAVPDRQLFRILRVMTRKYLRRRWWESDRPVFWWRTMAPYPAEPSQANTRILWELARGSVGLPKPSAVVDTNALSSAQYLGFVTGTGAYSQSGTVGRSSHLASFGFSSKPATCSALTPGTATTIYGGDYANGRSIYVSRWIR